MSYQSYASRFLYLLSLIFGVVAIEALFIPLALVNPVEIAIDSPSSFAEIRAGYGGGFGGLALLYWMGARNETIRSISLKIAVVVLGLFSLGRFVSLALEGIPNTFSMMIHSSEMIGCLISLAFLRLSLKDSPPVTTS